MSNRPLITLRCAAPGCRRLFVVQHTRRVFFCPACERQAQESVKALDGNRSKPELPR